MAQSDGHGCVRSKVAPVAASRLFGRSRGAIASLMIAACVAGQAAQATNPAREHQTARQEPLGLTYIANEGVLVSSGETKALIDALFGKPNEEYRAPSAEVLDKIMNGKAPFDEVDLVLVTHDHPDHFDARLATRYMETFPGAVLVAPSDAVEEMRKVAPDWTAIAPRVVSLDIRVGGTKRWDPKRIPVTAFRTLHSGDRDSPANLMYLVELDGWRVFHEGDSNGNTEEYRGFGLGSAPVDLALVHFWFPLEPKCAEFVQEALKPDHVALIHLPIRLEGDAPGKIDHVRKYYRDLALLLPGTPAHVFQKRSPV